MRFFCAGYSGSIFRRIINIRNFCVDVFTLIKRSNKKYRKLEMVGKFLKYFALANFRVLVAETNTTTNTPNYVFSRSTEIYIDAMHQTMKIYF